AADDLFLRRAAVIQQEGRNREGVDRISLIPGSRRDVEREGLRGPALDAQGVSLVRTFPCIRVAPHLAGLEAVCVDRLNSPSKKDVQCRRGFDPGHALTSASAPGGCYPPNAPPQASRRRGYRDSPPPAPDRCGTGRRRAGRCR